MTLALLRALEALMSRMRPILRAHGVTEQQWRVLRILSDLSEVEVTVLARLALLHPPSLTRILRDLTARGHVQRRGDDTDMRRSLVRISVQGLELIALAGPEVARATDEVQALYGDKRGRQLRELLTELEQVLGGVVGAADPED